MEPLLSDAPLIIASLLMLAVLIASAALWIRHVQKPQEVMRSDVGVPAWKIGWVNFGIFGCAIIITVFIAQQLVLSRMIDPPENGEIELTPWLALVSVFILQGPMIAVFYLSRRLYPSHFSGRLSRRTCSAGESFRAAAPLFIMLLPLVWITSLLWSGILTVLQNSGLIESFPPQPLVTLFQSGGGLPAILALVFAAIVVAPIVEEIIFRGCIYRFLKSEMTLLPAQIISGALFALVHGNLMSFLPLFVVGVLLARVYEKSGNIGVAIWFHAFFNAFSLSLLFITGMSDPLTPEY